ncbi:serine protein kinase RIO [Candidatus Woesearchaeota archaeon]|nr:serine protein kinase RIO [Candidatus Woesearchaeota archaeon]
MTKSPEKFKTYGNVFDEFTKRNLFKLSSQGHFDRLESPISIGKEANIFSALKKDGSRVIVKIYRLETCDFNRMYDYIKADPRFTGIKRKRRDVIFTWAQREYRNLMKAREVIRVPTPITQVYNILVLEFIGDENAAPKLKDAIPENPQVFFNEVVDAMRKLYKKGLVHGDLSAFNILNHNETAVFIDFSQTMPADTFNAQEYLVRDIKNVCTFFRKQGLRPDEEEIKKKITH